MISGTHTIKINATTETVWAYLADFNNWAPYVVGFQSFRRVDDETSVWTLKGDVGVLSRDVDLEVKVLEWLPGERAGFSITGITERLDGTGAFEIEPVTAVGGEENPAPVIAERQPSAWRRFTRWLAMRMLRRARARTAPAHRQQATTDTTAVPAPSRVPASQAQAGEQCALTFSLEVTPGGPMAPMVEMLMKPLLEPAAEDLSTQIRVQVEGASRV